MIRMQTENGWLLIRHQDHARLAGEIASRWGNETFTRPEPFADVQAGVSRHDDAWASRDARPECAPDGTPSAFSRELVGTYSAFENIDLEAYLWVRGEATEAVASDNPLAAILVSMHTVNLLTEQADLSGLNPGQRALHATFIRQQRERQQELKAALPAPGCPDDAALETAFRFLQACDSLSLAACVRYASPIALRHSQPIRDGDSRTITCHPLGSDQYRLEPYPLADPEAVFSIPVLQIEGESFASDEDLQAACEAGTTREIKITIHP
jgi:hypothetical protein